MATVASAVTVMVARWGAGRGCSRGHQHLITEHQRRYAETLPDARFEVVDSSHFIQAEQPGIVADRAADLLDQASRTGTPSLP